MEHETPVWRLPTSASSHRPLWVALLVLAGVLAAPPPARAVITATSGSVTMVSEAGDSIGGGTDRLFATPKATLSVRGGPGDVEVSASGGGESFSFEFVARSGEQLEVGEYAGAERYTAQPAGPGLEMSGNGTGCNNDYGRFVVEDIHVNGSGNVDRFWALYEQHCESPEAPALFGEVRVGEPATGAAVAVAPTAIEWPSTPIGTNGVHVPVTVLAGESGAHVTAIGVEGENAGDFSVSSDGCTGAVLSAGARCQLAVAVKPTAVGVREAELVVTDASGAKTTVPLGVFAEPEEAPPLDPPPSEAAPARPIVPATGQPGPPPTNGPAPRGEPVPGATPQPPHLQITPTKPRAGRPDVYVELGAVRKVFLADAKDEVLGYKYYFSARILRCINGATDVVFTIAGRRHTASCKASSVVIGGEVTPHNTYTLGVQAVKMRRHRVQRRGATYGGALYMPGNEAAWTSLASLPPAA